MGTDSATDLKPIDAAKVRAIASRLASDHDGEVVAAARALVRIAAAAGKRVEDLIAAPVPDYMNQPLGRGWPKTGPAMSTTEGAKAADAFMRAAGFADWFNDLDGRLRRAQSKKPNWKFIVDGLCLVGKAGLLNIHDRALLASVKRGMDESPEWTPLTPKFAAHILELARRHGIVSA